MAGYVFIAARDPWESSEGLRVFELAGSLAENRDAVTVYLTENGAFAARAGAGERVLSPLIEAGVNVLVDPFALQERGITRDRMVEGVVAAPIEQLVDLLVQASSSLWF